MLNLVENPGKSVLCIGRLAVDSYKDAAFMERYNTRLHALYRQLASEGFNTYLYTAWDFFDIASADVLRTIKPELLRSFRLPYVYSMAVFGINSPVQETPSYTGFFDGILFPQNDDARLTTSAMIDDILSSVSAVLFDNAVRDPFVRSVLERAVARNKLLLEVRPACGE